MLNRIIEPDLEEVDRRDEVLENLYGDPRAEGRWLILHCVGKQYVITRFTSRREAFRFYGNLPDSHQTPAPRYFPSRSDPVLMI